jgi:hypothetical protein
MAGAALKLPPKSSRSVILGYHDVPVQALWMNVFSCERPTMSRRFGAQDATARPEVKFPSRRSEYLPVGFYFHQ